MRRIRTILPLLVVVHAVVACEGAAGPMGPEGPQGPPGPGTKLVLSATVNAGGSALANLPSEAGTLQNPPGLTCLLSDTAAGPFLLIGTDLDGPICGLGAQGGSLAAFIERAPPGWVAQFVVVF